MNPEQAQRIPKTNVSDLRKAANPVDCRPSRFRIRCFVADCLLPARQGEEKQFVPNMSFR